MPNSETACNNELFLTFLQRVFSQFQAKHLLSVLHDTAAGNDVVNKLLLQSPMPSEKDDLTERALNV